MITSMSSGGFAREGQNCYKPQPNQRSDIHRRLEHVKEVCQYEGWKEETEGNN